MISRLVTVVLLFTDLHRQRTSVHQPVQEVGDLLQQFSEGISHPRPLPAAPTHVSSARLFFSAPNATFL